jgi:hypothetical protein
MDRNKKIEQLKKELNEHLINHSTLDSESLKLSEELDQLIAIEQRERAECMQ